MVLFQAYIGLRIKYWHTGRMDCGVCQDRCSIRHTASLRTTMSSLPLDSDGFNLKLSTGSQFGVEHSRDQDTCVLPLNGLASVVA
jgi:hypothetical protein